MARSGGLFTPFGPSSQAPTLFRFALLEPEAVLIISVALTNSLRDKYIRGDILLRGRASEMARSGGFEPPTAWFVARYSIQLSYERASEKVTIKHSKKEWRAREDSNLRPPGS